MTTLVDAAVKPTVGRYVTHPHAGWTSFAPGRPVLRDEVQRRGAVGRRGGAPADHDRAVRPAAGVLGAALVAARRVRPGADLRRGGTSTDVSVVLDGEPTLTTEGSVGAYPSKIPMIDVVTVGAGGGSVAWLSPEGALKVGPRSAGADPGPMCYPAGGGEPTVTDAHVALGRIPPTCSAAKSRLTSSGAGCGLTELGAKVGLGLKRTATGILEVSAWNQANALRRITVARASTSGSSR